MKSQRRLRITFLPTMNSGTAFYRCYQFAEEMNRLGIAKAKIPFFKFDSESSFDWQFHTIDNPMIYGRAGLNALVDVSDVVVVQYLLDVRALCLIEALKACHPKTVFLTEIDDYILDTPAYNEAFTTYQPGYYHRELVMEQLRALDGIIVSTPFLSETYKEYNPNIHVVPNCINFQWWGRVRNKPHRGVRLGWMGGGAHTEDLRTIEKPLKDFLKAHPEVMFYCVHGAPEFFKDQPQIKTPREWFWMNEYHKSLGRWGFDIGLAPLVDNNFNRAKSNLRKLEYGALGIPVVAANVGHFSQTIKHGKDGFLYNTPEEFYRELELLVSNAELRKKMGEYNKLDVKLNFNLERVAQDYVRILKEAHGQGQTTTVDVSERPERRSVNPWIEAQPEPLSV